MLRRVAALCGAVFIVVALPGYAGSDTDTFWNSPSAATLAWKRMLAPRPEQTAEQAFVPPDEKPAAEAHAPADTPQYADVTQHADAPQSGDVPHQDEHPRRTVAIEPVAPPTALPLSPPVPGPFGLDTAPVVVGGILAKWSGVEEQIRAGNEILAHCREDAQSCPKAARLFLDVVAQGRAQSGLARIGMINRAVNMAIEPMSDMAQWGVPDRWSAPLETFATGRGDCEDYAIAKYVALMAAGIPAQDVKLVVIRNTAANEDHAVVAVRQDAGWIILDNRWLRLVKDAVMPNAIPLFVLDDEGVRRFAPPAMTVAQRAAAPASVRF